MPSQWPVLLDQRIQLYRFLGRLFLAEVDPALLDRLRGVSAAEAPPTLSEGFSLIETGLRETRADVLTDLAVDYARIFLGAGLVLLTASPEGGTLATRAEGGPLVLWRRVPGAT